MAPTELQDGSSAEPDQAARLRYLQRFVILVQERLVADHVTDLDLRKAARVLRPSDFDAVIEERVHMHRCGLPTCPNSLPEANESAPKYRIRLAERQVVHAQAPALQSYCSSACAARCAAYRAGLLDVHIQYRDIVREPRSLRGRDGPVGNQVVQKTSPPTPTESLPATNSFADMLFELSRIARTQLDRQEEASSSPCDVLAPEPGCVSPDERQATLSRFGCLFVMVSRWCQRAGPSSDVVLDQVRARVRRYCPDSFHNAIESDLERLLSNLGIADDDLPDADDDWIAVGVAMIQSVMGRQTMGEIQHCVEGCRHSSQSCLIGLLAPTGYDQHHIDCLAECFIKKAID